VSLAFFSQKRGKIRGSGLPGKPEGDGIDEIVSLACPSCREAGARLLDRISASYEFAGRTLDRPIAGGGLYKCGDCGMLFRYPRLPKQELDALYGEGALDSWQGMPALRPDCIIIADFIRSQEGVKSVLDVGCFNGNFLDFLGPAYDRFGIEIHPGAAELARQKGISIVGRDFSDLDGLRAQYDCVVAIDVIEHAEDPAALLASLAGVTRPGGVIVISTGNPDAWSWRVMRGMYWYCTIPEHIAFISPRWCGRTARRLQLTLRKTVLFSHEPLPWLSASAQAAANLLYRLAPRLAFELRRLYARAKGRTPAPWFMLPPPWRCARDHHVAVFQTRNTPEGC